MAHYTQFGVYFICRTRLLWTWKVRNSARKRIAHTRSTHPRESTHRVV